MKKTMGITFLMSVLSLLVASNQLQASTSTSDIRFIAYKCLAKGDEVLRPDRKPGDVTFMFYEERDKKNEQTISLTDFIGHVEVTNAYSTYDELLRNENYYSVFHEKKMMPVTNYKPKKYVNHLRFNIQEKASNTHDGGGMNGYLALAPHATAENFKLHFVFQSGDHIGGTIDLTCFSL